MGLFRKIREQFLNNDRLTDRIVYAIGEILIVVIGILIALKVNNWNEERKNSNQELGILKAIRNDLNANITSLNSRIRSDSLVINRCDKLLGVLEDDNPEYDESLNEYFGAIESWLPIHPNKLGYTNLQSKGLSIISNDSLRSKIVQLFDQTYLMQEDVEKVMLELFSSGISMNHKYLETGETIFEKRPNDFQSLRDNTEFKNYLTHTRGIRQQLMEVTNDIVKSSSVALRDQIDKEIMRLEK